jgi:hypothetical protein
MTETTITCPNCGTAFPLTESLAAPIIEETRAKFQEQLKQKDEQIREREASLQSQKQSLQQERDNLEATIGQRLTAARQQIAEEEQVKARRLVDADVQAKAHELAEAQRALAERDEKLAEAQKAQVEFLRKQRELDDARREMDLTIEKSVQEKIGAARDQAKKDAEEALLLRVREKEETISSMQRQIEDLKRRAEQGSQQLQGEVLEMELESLLRTQFPRDDIQPVPKGEFGGDLIQRVVGPSGEIGGSILWELKRTRNWSDGWLSKLRGDQRQAKADVALIVSQALPKDVETFGLIDGVWVTSPRCALPVAIALRELLVSVAVARQSGEGQKTKTELVYEYLTGPRFRHRIEAIVEQFTEMREDLERERKTMMKLWARREAQIRCVVDSTAGMYGDLQGIAGRSIQEIEGLSFQLLDGPA